MPKLEWEGWKINFGHVLTIATILVGLATAWATVKADQAADRRRLEAVETKVERLVIADEALRTRQADTEREMVRVVTRLETLIGGIQQGMSRIERQLEREPRSGPP